MKVSECMTPAVEIASPEDTIQHVARTLREIDAGAMPVGENDRLVGMITDRDIAVRAIADGKGPDTRVREVMSKSVRYCFEDEDIEDVSEQMADHKIRRLPVLNRDSGWSASSRLAMCRCRTGSAAVRLWPISRSPADCTASIDRRSGGRQPPPDRSFVLLTTGLRATSSLSAT